MNTHIDALLNNKNNASMIARALILKYGSPPNEKVLMSQVRMKLGLVGKVTATDFEKSPAGVGVDDAYLDTIFEIPKCNITRWLEGDLTLMDDDPNWPN